MQCKIHEKEFGILVSCYSNPSLKLNLVWLEQKDFLHPRPQGQVGLLYCCPKRKSNQIGLELRCVPSQHPKQLSDRLLSNYFESSTVDWLIRVLVGQYLSKKKHEDEKKSIENREDLGSWDRLVVKSFVFVYIRLYPGTLVFTCFEKCNQVVPHDIPKYSGFIGIIR